MSTDRSSTSKERIGEKRSRAASMETEDSVHCAVQDTIQKRNRDEVHTDTDTEPQEAPPASLGQKDASPHTAAAVDTDSAMKVSDSETDSVSTNSDNTAAKVVEVSDLTSPEVMRHSEPRTEMDALVLDGSVTLGMVPPCATDAQTTMPYAEGGDAEEEEGETHNTLHQPKFHPTHAESVDMEQEVEAEHHPQSEEVLSNSAHADTTADVAPAYADDTSDGLTAAAKETEVLTATARADSSALPEMQREEGAAEAAATFHGTLAHQTATASEAEVNMSDASEAGTPHPPLAEDQEEEKSAVSKAGTQSTCAHDGNTTCGTEELIHA